MLCLGSRRGIVWAFSEKYRFITTTSSYQQHLTKEHVGGATITFNTDSKWDSWYTYKEESSQLRKVKGHNQFSSPRNKKIKHYCSELICSECLTENAPPGLQVNTNIKKHVSFGCLYLNIQLLTPGSTHWECTNMCVGMCFP